MVSRKEHPAELRERAVRMVFELRAETGTRVARSPGSVIGWASIPRRATPLREPCACKLEILGAIEATPNRLIWARRVASLAQLKWANIRRSAPRDPVASRVPDSP
jgi:hypothetical protein